MDRQWSANSGTVAVQGGFCWNPVQLRRSLTPAMQLGIARSPPWILPAGSMDGMEDHETAWNPVCVFVCVCRHMYICSNMHHYNISHQYTHRERGWKKDRPGRQRERVSFQHPVLPLPRGRFKRSVWGPMRLRLEPPGLTSGDRGTGKCFCRWNRWFYLTHRLTPNFQRLYPGCWEQPGLIFGLQLEITKMICIGFWWILMSCNWPRLRYGHARMAHVLHKFLQGYPWVLAAHPPLGPEAGKTGESSRNGRWAQPMPSPATGWGCGFAAPR